MDWASYLQAATETGAAFCAGVILLGVPISLYLARGTLDRLNWLTLFAWAALLGAQTAFWSYLLAYLTLPGRSRDVLAGTAAASVVCTLVLVLLLFKRRQRRRFEDYVRDRSAWMVGEHGGIVP